MQKSVKRLLGLFNIYKKEIRAIYIYAVLVGLVNLSLPLGIQAIINYLQTGEISTSWMILVGVVLFGIALSGIFQIWQLRIVENIQQDIFTRASLEFSYRIPKISYIKLDKIHFPELVNRFFDVLTIQKSIPKILIDLSLAVFQIIFGLIVLAVYSPVFILLGITLFFVIWLIIRVTGPKGLDASLVESKYKYQMAHWLQEVARLNRTFKINRNQNFHMQQSDDIATRYLTSREKHFSVLITQFKYFIVFKVFVAASLLVLGGFLVFQDQMNIGQFVAAEIIIILIISSIEKIIRTIDTVYDALTAVEKIGFVTDLPLDMNSGKSIIAEESAGLSIDIKEIDFNFPENNRSIFKDFSLQIDSGEKVLITGDTNSGKTILLQLIAGIHQVQNGIIYIDKIPLNNYRTDSFNQNIALNLPVNQIFEGTLYDNLTLGNEVSDRYLNEILNHLNLQDFLIHLPEGLKTRLDSQGRKLPKNIIQKILLARTLLGKPKLLLLEDPLLNFSEDEQCQIINYIMREDNPQTVIVVSHQSAWKTSNTRIVNLKQNQA